MYPAPGPVAELRPWEQPTHRRLAEPAAPSRRARQAPRAAQPPTALPALWARDVLNVLGLYVILLPAAYLVGGKAGLCIVLATVPGLMGLNFIITAADHRREGRQRMR